MDLYLKPITKEHASQYFAHTSFSGDYDFAISVTDETNKTHGVIAMRATGNECALAHLYTDGTALVGSILYGAAWRAAKALGYKEITI